MLGTKRRGRYAGDYNRLLPSYKLMNYGCTHKFCWKDALDVRRFRSLL